VFAGTQYRPFLTNNVILQVGGSVFVPTTRSRASTTRIAPASPASRPCSRRGSHASNAPRWTLSVCLGLFAGAAALLNGCSAGGGSVTGQATPDLPTFNCGAPSDRERRELIISRAVASIGGAGSG